VHKTDQCETLCMIFLLISHKVREILSLCTPWR